MNRECCSCGIDEGCEELYKYNSEIYCADCLLVQLEERKEIETFSLGIGYMLNGEFIGNDQDNDLDEIVEELIGVLDIEKVEEDK